MQIILKILNYIDEPFADPASLAVYVLSNKTAEHVKVALSGDGADEVWGGYNKYRGEYQARHPDFRGSLVSNLYFLWNALPKGKNSSLANKIR